MAIEASVQSDYQPIENIKTANIGKAGYQQKAQNLHHLFHWLTQTCNPQEASKKQSLVQHVSCLFHTASGWIPMCLSLFFKCTPWWATYSMLFFYLYEKLRFNLCHRVPVYAYEFHVAQAPCHLCSALGIAKVLAVRISLHLKLS